MLSTMWRLGQLTLLPNLRSADYTRSVEKCLKKLAKTPKRAKAIDPSMAPPSTQVNNSKDCPTLRPFQPQLQEMSLHQKILDKPWTSMHKYEKLFGFHEETQCKDRQVSMLLHDIMVWSIHKTRIAIVIDSQEHEDIAFKCTFLSDLLIAIKGQWIQAQGKKTKKGLSKNGERAR
ncbi:uncharacterized protein VTP21DRAFT_6291 [Calcarisporiella thermophila]|uniref:uncharacterized protein n=1 Tax=Calcarisporiella thermophila TaxID=911321 RepID=UPI0037421BDB